jgi:hypothetical protein
MNRNESRAVEVGIYQNGELRGQIYSHHIGSLAYRSEFACHVPSTRNPAQAFTVRGRFGAELVDDYLTISELWLIDGTNCPIGPPRPALWYLGASDVPLTTVFQANRDYPISLTGIWVVTLRTPNTLAQLRAQQESTI